MAASGADSLTALGLPRTGLSLTGQGVSMGRGQRDSYGLDWPMRLLW